MEAWQYFTRRFSRILKIAFIVVLLLLPAFFIAKEAAQWSFLEQPESQAIDVSPEGKVSKSEVPKTFSEREEAPPVALLPSRLDTKQQDAPVPLFEQRAILLSALRFLSIWESYKPKIISGTSSQYSRRLQPFVTAQGAVDIFERRDVSTIEDLCPQEECSKGSELIGRPILKIVDFSGQQAYLTGQGLVRVLEVTGSSSNFAEQEYALLMEKSTRGWLVSRAAAETSSS